ncbi:nitrite/sulfite reductase [Angustibacter luteus]|uniref:assimilatory sulfite reductase (ferredoxin) n=1 Tax=Angustibacter luteus TaxID=658456 RepID=A0ABW1JE58_9ACTN
MTATIPTSRAGRPPAPQGQWALGDRTPLNANERFKQEDDALNVRARIEQVYAVEGFDAITSDDLHGRFRWWGLYTQRKPGIDGGRTGSMEPEELEDKYFMLRVRVDGGALTTEQLRTIGEVSVRYGRGTADLTDRQNIQLHWIRVEDMPAIWERLEGVGLLTTEACGDCPRVILGSPVAGIAADEIIDPTPAIEEIQRRYVGDPAFSNLPRKYKSAITGMATNDVVHEINDIAFTAVVHPEHGPGFDLWVGGGLSTNPRLAVRLGAFVPLDDVPDVWAGVTSVFRDYGYRKMRHKARLKFLLADWGPERFREVLETEYLGRALLDGPAPEPTADPGDHIGVHAQRDGLHYIGAAPHVGRVSGETLTQLADLVESHGSQRIRLTPHQKLLVLDVPSDAVEAVVEGLGELGLDARPSLFRRHTMACTGIEYCKLAIVETKGLATATIGELETRLADVAEQLDGPITVNVNGCPNSCARIQVADIGLKGQIVTDDDGEQVPGFQVHLGGALGLDPGFGRKVRGLKVTAEELPDYVERVVRRYLAERAGGERFATWAVRAPEEALS